MADSNSSGDILSLTAQIVSAHVANNAVLPSNLPHLIEQVYQALTAPGVETPEAVALVPAVPVKRSVFPDHIVCLEDGEKLQILKRHLATSHNLTPDQYRKRWNLPDSYPIVAPNYAGRRSALAKEIGLGRKRDAPAADADAARQDQPAKPAVKPVGRPRKVKTV